MNAVGPRRRLAIFIPSFRGGGAERVMVTLARGFAKRGALVDIVVAQNEGPNAPPAGAGLRIVDLRAKRVLAAIPGLVRYLRRESPDVMASALPHANVVAVWARDLARSATRIVLTEHNTASLLAAHAVRARARLLPRFMRHAYPRADALVAVSDGVARDLAQIVGIDRSAVKRIYNPVVHPGLLRLADGDVGHPWFARPEPPVVLGVGRLTAQKDFSTLIQAFAEVRGRRPLRLAILGEGEERGRLEALARELRVQEDVALPGFVENPYPYMRHAALFALSSRWEGLANVLVEALACGTAVVSTDCPSGPAEILEQGRHGRLVPVGDAHALAEAIEMSLGQRASPAAVERAQAFSVDAALDRYADVFHLR